jgi:hypothetical protein
MVIYNRSRMAGGLPAQLGSLLRQPLRVRMRLGSAQSIGNLGALQAEARARLAAAERAGVVERGQSSVGLGRVTEAGVEVLLTVRAGAGGHCKVQGPGRPGRAPPQGAGQQTRPITRPGRRNGPASRSAHDTPSTPGHPPPPPKHRPRCSPLSLASAARAPRSCW